jgi:hypothetical protein
MYTVHFLLLRAILEGNRVAVMGDASKFAARYEDLLLTATRYGALWRVRVEEADVPNSALSGGAEYPTVERAKQGAISIALELFGTDIPAEALEWQPIDDPLID